MRELFDIWTMRRGHAVATVLSVLVSLALPIAASADNFGRNTNAKNGPTEDKPAPPECDSCPCPPEGEDGSGADDGSDTAAETSNASSSSPKTGVAGPVDPYTGRFSVRRTDITVPGVFPIEFTRSYDSLSHYDSPLGYGWSHNFDMRVYEYPNDEVILRLREGRRLRYLMPASGNVLTPTETSCGHTPRMMILQPAGTYVATLQNGNRAFFDVEGRLETLENPQGNRLRFSYAPAEVPLTGRSPFAMNPSLNLTVARYWQLTMIREQLKSQVAGDIYTGRSLTLNYNDDGRLVSVESHDDRVVTYSYAEEMFSDDDPAGGIQRGNLAKVTGLAEVIEEYRYPPASNPNALEMHQVRWMKLGEGTEAVINTYQSDGRVQSQSKGQSTWTFAYTGTPASQTTTVERTIVTTLPPSPPITTFANTTFEYNPDGFLKRKRDALGNDILYKRDAGPDIDKIEVYSGAATPENLVRTVDLEYAPGGQLKERNVTLAGPLTVTETFDQDPEDPEFTTFVSVASEDSDPNVFQTHYVYFEAPDGRPTNLQQIRRVLNPTVPVQEITSFDYDANGQLEFITPPAVSPADGLQIQRIYYTTADDAADPEARKRVGLLKTIQLLANPGPAALPHLTRTFDYDAQGLVRLVTDARGHQAEFEWDARARLRRITQKLTANSTTWESTFFTYGSPNEGETPAIPATAGDLLLQVENGAVGPLPTPSTPGQIRRFRWNSRGRLVKIERDDGTGVFSEFARFTYDSDGNRLTAEEAFNGGDRRITTFTYDQMRRLETVADEASNVVEFDYDVLGNRTAVTDAKNQETTFHYDELDRLVKTVQPGPTALLETLFSYDAAGNVISVTDPKDLPAQTTKYLYDPLSRLLEVSQPVPASPGTFAATSAYRYDGRGRLDRVTNARLQVMNYLYEPWGGLNRVEHFLNATDANAGTPIQRTVAYGYDVNGNLRSTSDSLLPVSAMAGSGSELVAGRLYTFTYDPLNRVKDVLVHFIPGGVFSTSTYDSVGNKSSLSVLDTAGFNHVWTFDKRNRLTAICMPQDHPCLNPGDETLAFSYFENDDLQQTTHGNGLTSALTYLPHGPLDVVTTTGPASAVPLLLDYAYDPNLNVDEIRERRSAGGADHVFDPSYDTIDRFTSMVYPTALGFAASESFGYDAAGNRLNAPPPVTWTYDVRNRITAIPGRDYAFDDDGNLTTITVNPGAGQRVIPLTWSFDHRLLTYDLGGPDSESYLYDPFGRRVQKTNASITRYYLWDGDRLIGEYDGSGNRVVRYAYADGFAPAQVAFGSGASEAIYDVHVDHLDTPRMLTDSAGSPKWRASYEGFGRALIASDPDGDANPTNNVPAFNIRFPGQYFDDRSGMHDNRFRTYDPTIGRYVSGDPIGQTAGSNLYIYGMDDPLNRIDPLGLIDFGDELNARIASRPLRSVWSIYQDGFSAANNHPLSDPNPNTENQFENDYRHCYTSCTETRHAGSANAEALGDANEWWTDESNPSKCERTDDSERDQRFNERGREIGREARSDDACHSICTIEAIGG